MVLIEEEKMGEQLISVNLHFSGKIEIADPRYRYVGGVKMCLGLDVDNISFSELVDTVWDMSVNARKDYELYAVIPGDGALKLLLNDRDLIEIATMVEPNSLEELDIYVQPADEAWAVILSPPRSPKQSTIEPIPNQPNTEPTKAQFQPSSPLHQLPNSSGTPKHTKLTARKHVQTPLKAGTPIEQLQTDVQTPLKAGTPIEQLQTDVQTPLKAATPIEHLQTDDGSKDVLESDQEGTDDTDGSEDDDSEDEDYKANLNEDDGSEDEEFIESVRLLERVNKEDADAKKKLLEGILKQPAQVNTPSSSQHIEGYSSYEDSDGDVQSPGESEDDNIRGKKYIEVVPVVDEDTDFNRYKWVVGTRFASREDFKKAVQKYAITNGRNLKILKSDSNDLGKLVYSCVKGCPFKLYLSYHTGKACFMIKSVTNRHRCQRNMQKNRQLTQYFIAEDLLPIFKARPNWPAKEIQMAVKEKHKVLISKWMAYHAKTVAHKILHGSMREHYSKLGSYVAALRDTNPTSTFVLDTLPPAEGCTHGTFFRLFICFDGLRKGFLAGCRKMLCLDGCFLKTFLGGMLLTAVGRDGNDQMFPLAWAVVEGENNESWEWFMAELYNCLGINNGGKGWTLMSDQQKGLLNAMNLVWKNAEHRNCARHIYANWHKKFKGEDLKAAFWKACRSYNIADYKDAIKELTELNADGVEALNTQQNPKAFTRCFLDNETKCDVIVNNMAETFNGYIVQARSKHIIHMLEDIRVSVMSRLVRMRSAMENKEVVVCPRIQKKLDKEKYWSYKCEVYPSSLNEFQVRDYYDDVTVNLGSTSCTCKKWDLTGIPCKHVCAVAEFLGKTAEEYVHEFYTKDTYMKAYEFTIPPLPSERYWPMVEQPLDPPPVKAQPGRPKKNRKRDPNEEPKKSGNKTKQGIMMKCSHCKSPDHNIRRCPEKAKGTPKVITKSNMKRGKPKGTSRPGSSKQGGQSTQTTQPEVNPTQNSQHEVNPSQQSKNSTIGSKRSRGSQASKPSTKGKGKVSKSTK